MARKPSSKGILTDPYLIKQPIQWAAPRGPGTAEMWRTVSANQPVAELCKQKLVLHAQATEWGIEARQAEDTDKYKEEIDYYTDLLDNIHMPFDEWVELMVNDMLDLPQGATSELVRWGPGKGPLKYPHHLGHVHEMWFLDGATVRPTGDRQIPIVQAVGNDAVWFKQAEVARMLSGRRPELALNGYSRPPLEKAYLAVQMLYYGDSYYAKYLIDTPEAGILYLGDMTQDSAETWLSGFRALFSGIAPFKIPVIAETERPPQWIPLNQDPSKIAYDTTIDRYSRIVAAAYGMKLSDIGLDGGAETLAGKIRDERAFMGTGMGSILLKIENMINSKILPRYLIFRFKVHNEETVIQKMRARLMAGQAAKVLIESQIATAAELQQQFVLEGLLDVPLKKPKEGAAPAGAPGTGTGPGLAERATPTEARQNPTNGQIRNETRKVPVEMGGEGDIRSEALQKPVQRAALNGNHNGHLPEASDGTNLSGLFMLPEGMTESSVVADVVMGLAARSGVPEQHFEDVFMAWANRDDDPATNIQIQAVASDAFQAPLSGYQLEVIRGLDYEIKLGNMPAPHLPRSDVDLIVKSIYMTTQATLANAGIEYVTVYRGLVTSDPPSLEGDHLTLGNALTSWTASRAIAEMDARSGIGGYGVVLSATVPADMILSTGMTGMGSIVDQEIVMVLRGGSVLAKVESVQPLAYQEEVQA